MRIYAENGNYKLYHGNMLDMLDVIKPESIDSIVTDPPYELNFMNKGWDNAGVSFQKETWEKCYKVLKPCGYLLVFGGTRTFHRIACAIEDAGFEIRDTIMWLYGSGFPKSLNISKTLKKREGIIEETTGTLFNSPNSKRDLSKRSDYGYIYKPQIDLAKQWNGWGTQLKPAYEPIIVARKPCKGTIVDNILKYGVGGINIDECRVPFEDTSNQNETSLLGRFPANVILTYDESDFDEVCGGMPESKGASSQNNNSNGHIYRGQSLQESTTSLSGYREWYNDEGSASRYFYCAKASKRDRNEGLNDISTKNIHPTVKPVSLMQYLVRLVTPKGGLVLDPFNGSGSTGKAIMYENKDFNKDYKYIGIELTEEYLPIAKARIEYVCGMSEDELKTNKKLKVDKKTKTDETEHKQLMLF